MQLFRKSIDNTMPKQAQKYRSETHKAANEAGKTVAKLNTILMNGITLRIYHATGGKHK